MLTKESDTVNCANGLLGPYYPQKMRNFFLLKTGNRSIIRPLKWSISADGRDWNHGHPRPESVAGEPADCLQHAQNAVSAHCGAGA